MKSPFAQAQGVSPMHPDLRMETLTSAAADGGTPIADDFWHRVSDLLGLAKGDGCGVPEGTLQPQGGGVVLRMVRNPIVPGPAVGAPGLRIATDQPYNMGPANPGQCIRLDCMWVRNLTAGQNATVVFVGQLCRES